MALYAGYDRQFKIAIISILWVEEVGNMASTLGYIRVEMDALKHQKEMLHIKSSERKCQTFHYVSKHGCRRNE